MTMYLILSNISLDVDECEEGLAPCDANGHCMNTKGSYLCLCNPGYEGNGTTCAGRADIFNH